MPGGGNDVVAGRYELVDPLASGGSGTVWRAWDHARGGWCAAKVMRQRHAGELLRLVREQAVRLQHPHVASPYAWAAEDGTVLIASELVDGGSLQTLVGDYGPLDEPTVTVLLEQVLDGLAALHRSGLVHRDVKPANVLLRATGDGPPHALLTDFGLTIGLEDARLTHTGTVIGTPGYLPPEVTSGRRPPHPRQDVYAAGRLALALALGAEALDHDGGDGSGRGAAALQHPGLRAAVAAMTEADPDRRPSDAVAAAALLDGLPRSTAPRTRQGDPVTVFDQLPPAEPPVGAEVRVDVAGPATSVQAAAPPDRTEPQRLPGTRELPVTATAATAATVGTGPMLPAAPAPGSTTRRRLLAGAAVAVLVGAVAVAVAVTRGDGSRVPSDLPTSSSPTSAPPTSSGPSSGPSTTPSTTAPTVGTSAPVTSGAATVPTSAGGPASGDVCGWQQEGDRAATTGGQLVCRLVGQRYVWGPVGG
ncbi:serine/threonine protein kinase [Terracoccus luteus]|uniref:non-specific serine/threonine protein kinase n=1 Tax=Terracoccus luteus TaxID=53356 RepID=A0A495XRA3_9MICO|nr:serine/threonine-protein kinase [Terracoccus luteus]RKT77081.1 serine/threonine protein kinase [Terracoccus luteus]